MKLDNTPVIPTATYGLTNAPEQPISIDFTPVNGMSVFATLTLTRAEARKLGEQLRMMAALGGEP